MHRDNIIWTPHIRDTHNPTHGFVKIYAIDAKTNKIISQNNNTITFDARRIMAHCISADSNAFIAKIAWGTGTAAPTRNNSVLENAIIDTDILLPVTYPDNVSVIFRTSMSENDGNGHTYSEVGLKAADETLFARFVFLPGMPKTQGIKLGCDWTIIFT